MKAAFLDQFESSFALRRKFWKRKNASVNLQRKFDDSSQMEKVEILLRPLRQLSKAMFQITAWEDRWIWLDARESSKEGWAWEWTCEGRASPLVLGKPLAEKVEQSFDEISHANSAIALQLDRIWFGSLASGPKRVSK